MSDDRIEAKLAAYIDGDLPPEEVTEVERLLASNPRQRRIVEQMLHAKQLLASLPRERAPAALLEAIDPALERAALFAEAPAASSRWSALISPQALALAATLALAVTLVVAMLWLVPDANQPGPIVVRDSDSTPANVPNAGGGGGQDLNGPIARNDPAPTRSEGGALPHTDDRADRDRPESGVDAQNDTERFRESAGEEPSGVGVSNREMPLFEAGVADPVLVSADVASVPQARVAVSEFLADADLPFGARRVSVETLPATLRTRLDLPDDQAVLIYVVEEISLEQVGTLTAQLSASGTARALAPAGFASRRDRATAETSTTGPASDSTTQTVTHEQGVSERNSPIIGNDRLRLLITRNGTPPAETPAGTPAVGSEAEIEVSVSADGYADFGAIGLSRIDVFGKLPTEVAALVRAELLRFQIDANVEVLVATASAPSGGRTREAVQLMYLDREPLAAGNLVQIGFADGGWLQGVVNETGVLDAGEWGELNVAGKSALAVEEELRRLATSRPALRANEPAAPAAPVATSGIDALPVRVTNLTARRNQGVDSWSDYQVACVVVLHDSAAAPPKQADPNDEWAPLGDPQTRPVGSSTTPSTAATSTAQPTTRP